MTDSSDAPMFSLERLDGWRSPPGLRSVGVRLVAVGGSIVLVATSDGTLVCWNTASPSSILDSSSSSTPSDQSIPDPSSASSAIVEFARGARPEGSRISSLFVDPSGSHALVCVVAAGAGQTFYIATNTRTINTNTPPSAKEISGLRGHIIDAVAWAPGGVTSSTNTGAFLVGTAGGKVLLARVDDRREKEITRAWEGAPPSTRGGGPPPIASILWPSLGTVSVLTRAPLVWRTFTASSGGGIGPREAFLSPHAPTRSEGIDTSGAAPGALLRAVDLAISPAGMGSASTTFALLTTNGISMGGFASSGGSGGGGLRGGVTSTSSTLAASPSSSSMIRYPPTIQQSASSGGVAGGGNDFSQNSISSSSTGSGGGGSNNNLAQSIAPVSLALTLFHILLLYKHRLVVISRIAPEAPPAWESALPEERAGGMRGLLPVTGVVSMSSSLRPLITGGNGVASSSAAAVATTRGGGALISSDSPSLVAIAYSDRHIFRVVTTREGRDAWRLHLARGDFAAARRAAAGEKSVIEQIWAAEADTMLAAGAEEAAADAFAATSRPFEETCLRFLARGARAGLLRYLQRRWERLRSAGPRASPQRAVLATWLLECHLDGLNAVKGDSAARSHALRAFLRAAAGVPARGAAVPRAPDLDRATALTLLSSHGRSWTLLYYCRLVGEWGRVVAHHMARGEWRAALTAIASAPESASVVTSSTAAVAAVDIDDKNDGEIDNEYDNDDDDVADDDAAFAEAVASAPGPATNINGDTITNIGGGVEGDNHGESSGDEIESFSATNTNTTTHNNITTTTSTAPLASRPPTGSQHSRQELWYRHSALLLAVAPEAVTAGWRACRGLDTARLTPTIVGTQQTGKGDAQAATLLYLEWAIARGRARERRHRPVHNLLLLLYAGLPVPGGGDEGALEKYVERSLSGLPPAPPAGGALAAAVAALVGAAGVAPSAALLESLALGDATTTTTTTTAAATTTSSLSSIKGPPFDLGFALRAVDPNTRPRTAVRLLCAAGLYVEAVDTALSADDVILAKAAAGAPPRGASSSGADAIALSRRLWTRIACHVIARGMPEMLMNPPLEDQGDATITTTVAAVAATKTAKTSTSSTTTTTTTEGPSASAANALKLLKESGCLRIEDILPYFPASTRLEDFKAEVTASLAEADSIIRRLRDDMRAYTGAAERIRGEIKSLHRRCASVRAGQRCDDCGSPVLSRALYAFPCGHVFHSDCLAAAVTSAAPAGQARRISALITMLARVNDASMSLTSGGLVALNAMAGELSVLLPTRNGGGSGHTVSDAARTGALIDIRASLNARADQLQVELDAIVGAQCLLCGDSIIATIFEPIDLEGAAEDEDWGV